MFKEIQEPTQQTIKELVEKNLTQKLDRYLLKYLKEDDAQAILNINITKNKKWTYNGKFNMSIDWHQFVYNREDFKNITDLVQHFFDHIKEQISKK